MNKKILYLDVDSDDFGAFFREQRQRIVNVSSQKLYRNCGQFIKKVCLFLGIHIYSGFLSLIYGEWKKHIEEYDIFILPSRKSAKHALKILKNKKVIVYYWNLYTDREMLPSEILSNNVFLCTFDEGDAKKFHIAFVDTYYFPLEKGESNSYVSDLFYIGVNRKGRQEQLQALTNELSHTNLICDFKITGLEGINDRLTYQEIIEKIIGTKVIVDLNRTNQIGLTLRPLEALTFEKKLITDNRNIANFKFYRKENIFILGEDNITDLYDFITSPYFRLENHYKEYYYFENWLERVIKYANY